jgi:hypothetical protein
MNSLTLLTSQEGFCPMDQLVTYILERFQTSGYVHPALLSFIYYNKLVSVHRLRPNCILHRPYFTHWCHENWTKSRFYFCDARGEGSLMLTYGAYNIFVRKSLFYPLPHSRRLRLLSSPNWIENNIPTTAE